MKGFINSYDSRKRFGFITSADGEDLFFHKKDCTREVLIVDFDVVQSSRGLKAVNVKTLPSKGVKLK